VVLSAIIPGRIARPDWSGNQDAAWKQHWRDNPNDNPQMTEAFGEIGGHERQGQ
jgi:hypothetical protein